jgi:UPF0716 protein FxsA
MGLFLLLIMIVVPIVEIAVFIQVGGWVGLWPTLGTVILTAMAGTALLRHQGFATLARARDNLNAGRFPIAEVFDGLCLVVAGALLLTPGFVTDAAGLLLFVPALRAALRSFLGRRLMESGRVQAFSNGSAPDYGGGNDRPRGPTNVIDGEFEEVDDNKPKPGNDPDTGNPWGRIGP